MSEMRGIIVVGTFLTVALFLILIMPSQFLGGATGQTYKDTKTIQDLLSQTNGTIYNFYGYEKTSPNIDIGGWHTSIAEVYPVTNLIGLPAVDSSNASRCFLFEVYDAIPYTDYFYNREDFHWMDAQTGTEVSTHGYVEVSGHFSPLIEQHTTISMDTLMARYLNTSYAESNTLFFDCQSSRCVIHMAFIFDINLYSSPLDAYNHMGLRLTYAIDFSERNTQINAWGFVFGIVFWQDIKGLDPTIATLLRIPFLLAMGYIIFIAVLRVIGAVFGGGGA